MTCDDLRPEDAYNPVNLKKKCIYTVDVIFVNTLEFSKRFIEEKKRF